MRPSFSTEEAALAAFAEVDFSGALVWDKALAAAVFDFVPVELDCSVLEAAFAALGLVSLDFATFILSDLELQKSYLITKHSIAQVFAF